MATSAALTGTMFLAGAEVAGATGGFRAINPATGAELDPVYAEASADQVNAAARAAEEAFRSYRHTDGPTRARFLARIAEGIDACDELPDRIHAETGIAPERILAERTRTSNQLRLFAEVVLEGSFQGLRIDSGDPSRTPLPKPDLRHRLIPVGPVAVFGASNFPLAFSVAGGDTAAALAAGCPVVVKAHEAHPGTSELVGRVINEAVAECGLPAGTFSMVFGRSPELAIGLVSHPAIAAVGFTGSRRAGLALVSAANAREIPIPVYAEMASVNPVFVLPGALTERADEIGRGLAASVLTGVGQLCTSPGLVFVADTDGADELREAAATAFTEANKACMLTPRIAESFAAGIDRVTAISGVREVASASGDPDIHAVCTPTLFETDMATFAANREALSAEIFGSVSLLVRTPVDQLVEEPLVDLEGQLTSTIHTGSGDQELAAELVDRLELRAGRIVFNGWSTGLEVNDAVIHGGPWPATSAPQTTSVGTRAIERFLRPVAYQNAPVDLLPATLRDEADGVWRRVDGAFSPDPVT